MITSILAWQPSLWGESGCEYEVKMHKDEMKKVWSYDSYLYLVFFWLIACTRLFILFCRSVNLLEMDF